MWLQHGIRTALLPSMAWRVLHVVGLHWHRISRSHFIWGEEGLRRLEWSPPGRPYILFTISSICGDRRRRDRNAHFISCEWIARVHYRRCKSSQRTGWMSGSALSDDHAFNSTPPSHYSVWWCGSKYSKSCAGHSFSERGFGFPMPRHSRPLYHQSDPTWWIHPVESNCHEM